MMLRDGWNFHNDIALVLANIARRHYGEGEFSTTKIYGANAIGLGHYVEVMIEILRDKTNREVNHHDIDQFVKDCAPYLGMREIDIPNEKAQELFERFQEIYRQNKD